MKKFYAEQSGRDTSAGPSQPKKKAAKTDAGPSAAVPHTLYMRVMPFIPYTAGG